MSTPITDITEWEKAALEVMANLNKSVVVIRARPSDPPQVQQEMYKLESSMTKFLSLGFVEEITEQVKKDGADLKDREFRVFKPTQVTLTMFKTERSCGDPDCENCKGEDLPIKQWVN